LKADFGIDGSVSVSLNGKPNAGYSPIPSQDSNKVVIKTMASIGAVIESSQWFGWAPAAGSCPGGNRKNLTTLGFDLSSRILAPTLILSLSLMLVVTQI